MLTNEINVFFYINSLLRNCMKIYWKLLLILASHYEILPEIPGKRFTVL